MDGKYEYGHFISIISGSKTGTSMLFRCLKSLGTNNYIYYNSSSCPTDSDISSIIRRQKLQSSKPIVLAVDCPRGRLCISKDNPWFEIAVNGRHMGITVIMVSSKRTDLCPAIRNNVTTWIDLTDRTSRL